MKAFVLRAIAWLFRQRKLYVISEPDLMLLQKVKRKLLPQGDEPQEDYVPQKKLGHVGYSLREEKQLAWLRTLQNPDYQHLFQSLRDDEEINVGYEGRDFHSQGLIHNIYYPSPDAELYAAMISSNKPNRIIEVGSGYSTLVARHTVEHLELDCEIHVIDPEPRTDIEGFAEHIEYKPVESSSLADFEFSERTLLFIDSSHVCKRGGDLPFLYCRLLPSLPAGVLVHIHDVFLPFDYPLNFSERFYTEAYLLHALLTHSTKFEVVLANHFLSREYPEAMQDALGPLVGQDHLFFGSSVWIRSRE